VVLPDTTAHLLRLVTVALDEFETAELPASVRRAWRIARLRGDTVEACRFAMELGVEEPAADLGMNERLAADSWFSEGRAVHDVDPRNLDLTEFQLIRLATLSLDEMVTTPRPYEDDLSLRSRMEWENRRLVVRQVMGRVRNDTFSYLMQCETTLRLAAAGSRIFDRHRARVDQHLRAVAPDVLDKLNAAIERSTAEDEPEARAHALTSCRRVLVAVADHVFPPQSEAHIGKDGKPHEVGASEYRNRLAAAVEASGASTYGSALVTAIHEFAGRLDRLDELTQKGVHGEVTAAEVDFGVINTYMVAGEVLELAAGTS
jgi:hypothetical protein